MNDRALPDWFLHGLSIFLHFLASLGALLILYGVITAFTEKPWPPLEQIASPLSSTLTLVGTAFTALSIYLYGVRPQRPAQISLWFVSPVVVFLCAITTWFVWTGHVEPVVINGFSVVGLAGALIRIVPRPSFFIEPPVPA